MQLLESVTGGHMYGKADTRKQRNYAKLQAQETQRHILQESLDAPTPTPPHTSTAYSVFQCRKWSLYTWNKPPQTGLIWKQHPPLLQATSHPVLQVEEQETILSIAFIIHLQNKIVVCLSFFFVILFLSSLNHEVSSPVTAFSFVKLITIANTFTSVLLP